VARTIIALKRYKVRKGDSLSMSNPTEDTFVHRIKVTDTLHRKMERRLLEPKDQSKFFKVGMLSVRTELDSSTL
jgi:hypothetical protein